jgi:hypothetical protein
MYSLNITLEVWEPDEIDEGVFKTVLTHPLFGGNLTFLSGSEEEADAFIKNLRNQFNTKYAEQQANANRASSSSQGSYSFSQNQAPQAPADDWKKDLVDVVGLAVTLGRALNKKKEDNDNRPGPKRPSF